MSHTSPENSPYGSPASRFAAIEAAFGPERRSSPPVVPGATPQEARSSDVHTADPESGPGTATADIYVAPDPPLTTGQMDAAIGALGISLQQEHTNQSNGEQV